MNRAIIIASIQQRLRSPVRMTLIAMAFVFPLIGVAVAPFTGLTSLGNGFYFAVILAAGMIGQEVSAGVLQLVFARPLRRWEYVLSRWAAFSLAAALLSLSQIGLGALLLAGRGYAPETGAMLSFAATQALAAVAGVSVLAMFSSLIGGLGDLALYLMTMLTGTVFQVWGSVAREPALLRVSQEISGFLQTQLDVAQVVAASSPPWFMIVSYFSTVTLCLSVAILMVNRRELSYASA